MANVHSITSKLGDDIGSGSVTDCLLRSFSDLKRQTEMHVRRLSEKQ